VTSNYTLSAKTIAVVAAHDVSIKADHALTLKAARIQQN
jgi:hypothetical protein